MFLCAGWDSKARETCDELQIREFEWPNLQPSRSDFKVGSLCASFDNVDTLYHTSGKTVYTLLEKLTISKMCFQIHDAQ